MATTDEGAEPPSIEHPLLEPEFLERRLYQLKLAGTAANGHTLVCLPTGLGKTTVSLLVTARRLEEVGGKSLMLAPTKPLVQQHADFYREALQIPDEEIVVFTGDVSPDDRSATWEEATIVMATPQVIENDLVGSRISLADVTHITFDECHRATGDYAYNYIAERYHVDANQPLVTGMSASPGGDEEAILEVCENLGISEVEVMTEEDADVSEFTHDTDVEWERIDLPEDVLEIRDALNEVITDRLEKLKELGVASSTQPDQSQKDLNRMRAELQKLINNDQSEGFKGMSVHAEVMKLRQAVTLVETQSVEAVRRYFDRQRNQARSSGASKASQRMVSDPRVREAMRQAESYDELHPKYRKTRMLLAETLGLEGGERVIVFTESRDTAEALTDFLSDSFDAKRFVGQGDREGSDGMTQKQQQRVLDQFRGGEFEVLVSTSVAEEGLDVPEVDLVLFYEPVPTAIRSIQRKGRTGRQSEGRVVVLMAEDTRDEAYFWISRRREKEMESELRELKGMADTLAEELDDSQQALSDFGGETAGSDDGDGYDPDAGGGSSSGNEGGSTAPGLQDFSDDVTDAADETESEGGDSEADADAVETHEPHAEGEQIEIVADQREMDANIARDLSRREDVEVRLETLEVGDYVCSDRVVVERKSVADFVDSLVGGERSIFEQVGAMARHYSRPIVLVEGEGLYEQRDIHPNAIRGALSSLAVDFGASVLRTESEGESTELLAVLAGREQQTSDREVSVHGEKGAKTVAEQQEYVVSSIAEIGPVTARSLLEEFGTVEAVMIASEDELQDADGVGSVTAERMREVIGTEYTGS
ncbi:DEAD/DEAH box helicase [Natronorubrum daqingense]|uniref:Fanconi anemia group M protein n=1 Tax=Natronorubrum daqingense TaxID=588898 RepID=A0A1N7F7K9_9EURY|nr:DEAD/DEAH box helicase [Natronorubrum daqingense]APX97590.1 Hef nuclease [Natronorubrum daqingense]SIR96327.1 fanconi anemia group M protein [Natronorubrum daqingense]